MIDGSVKITENNNVMICSILTDFTIDLETTIQDIYQNICSRGFKKILFEFNPDDHITGGGISILITLLSESEKREQKVGITGLSEHFKNIFDVIGITGYATIYDSIEEAVKSL